MVDTIKGLESVGVDAAAIRELLTEIAGETAKALNAIKTLEATSAEGDVVEVRGLTEALRAPIDRLEALLPDEIWPLPTYAEMMFMM